VRLDQIRRQTSERRVRSCYYRAMTELLRKAVAALSELLPEKQDVLAAMVLEEIACEQSPGHPVLSIEALEEEARLEYLAGFSTLAIARPLQR